MLPPSGSFDENEMLTSKCYTESPGSTPLTNYYMCKGDQSASASNIKIENLSVI